MSAELSEQAFASRLLLLNGPDSSIDLSYAVKVDNLQFGSDVLTFSPECFGDSIAEARHLGSDAPTARRGDDDGMIFNDRLPIFRAA